MQLSTCVNWRHVRHVITVNKTINELLSFMSGTITYQLSKEDRICTVQNFAVHGGVGKLSAPFRRTGVVM